MYMHHVRYYDHDIICTDIDLDIDVPNLVRVRTYTYTYVHMCSCVVLSKSLRAQQCEHVTHLLTYSEVVIDIDSSHSRCEKKNVVCSIADTVRFEGQIVRQK